MPSSRRPREIGRALRSATFGVQRLVPDSAVVNVVEKNERGWYNVRKPHWPEGVFMSVPLVPPDAAMPCPRPQTRLLFEDGDPQRPFVYWPWGRKGRRPSSVALDFYWPEFRNGSGNRIDAIHTQPEEVAEGVISHAILVRAFAGRVYIFGGSSTGEDGTSGSWKLNGGDSLGYPWLEFSVEPDGLLAQVDSSDSARRDVTRFEYPLDVSSGAPQTLRKTTFALELAWEWQLPTIDVVYSWDEGTPGPPGGGGGIGEG